MKTVLKIGGALLAVVLLAAGGFYAWAYGVSSRKLSTKYEVQAANLAIPFPLDSPEVRRLRLKPDGAAKLAEERAIARGEHLVESRYVCMECHGGGFRGGTMIDAPIIGRLFGPNLTTGKGSKTIGYTAADWDRIVRHGVRRDGLPAVMPSEDFAEMSDQELSDIVTYIRSYPPADNEMPERAFGPLGRVLLATGKIKLSVDLVPAVRTHQAFPPPTAVTIEFGKHLANLCTGCHRPDLAGGPIAGGDPSWPPARNLTPDATGLKGWTYQQFRGVMQDGKRPDGTALKEPMALMPKYAKNMTDTELQALWMYLQSVPAVERKI